MHWLRLKNLGSFFVFSLRTVHNILFLHVNNNLLKYLILFYVAFILKNVFALNRRVVK